MTARLVLDDFIPYRLSVASNSVSDAIASAYEALFGLTIPEWRLVAVIAESEGITQQAIGAAPRLDKVTVSRAALALERRLLETFDADEIAALVATLRRIEAAARSLGG